MNCTSSLLHLLYYFELHFCKFAHNLFKLRCCSQNAACGNVTNTVRTFTDTPCTYFTVPTLCTHTDTPCTYYTVPTMCNTQCVHTLYIFYSPYPVCEHTWIYTVYTTVWYHVHIAVGMQVGSIIVCV